MNASLKVAEEKKKEDGEENDGEFYLHKDPELSPAMPWPGSGQDAPNSKASHKGRDEDANFVKDETIDYLEAKQQDKLENHGRETGGRYGKWQADGLIFSLETQEDKKDNTEEDGNRIDINCRQCI